MDNDKIWEALIQGMRAGRVGFAGHKRGGSYRSREEFLNCARLKKAYKAKRKKAKKRALAQRKINRRLDHG